MMWETTGYMKSSVLHPLHAVMAGVGFFGLVLGVWAWRGDRSRGRRRCPRCLYDMVGIKRRIVDGGDGHDAVHADEQGVFVCPECGFRIARVADLYRPKRRKKVAALGVLMVLIGLYGQTIPRALRTGPLGLVPTTVLIAGMDVLPDSWYADTAGWATPSAVLSRRALDDEIWSWQAAWIDHATHGVANSKRPSYRALVNACAMVEVGRTDEARKLLLQWARLLADPKKSFKANNTSLLYNAVLRTYWIAQQQGTHSISETTYEKQIEEMTPMLVQRMLQMDVLVDSAICQLYEPLETVPSDMLDAAMQVVTQSTSRYGKSSAMILLSSHAKRDPAAMEDLLELLHSDDRLTQSLAAEQIASISGRNESPYEMPLKKFLEMETDPKVLYELGRAGARMTLGSTKKRSILEWLAHDGHVPLDFLRGIVDNIRPWNDDDVHLASDLSGRLLASSNQQDVLSALGFFLVNVKQDMSDWIVPVAVQLQSSSGKVRKQAANLLVAIVQEHPDLKKSVVDAVRIQPVNVGAIDASLAQLVK